MQIKRLEWHRPNSQPSVVLIEDGSTSPQRRSSTNHHKRHAYVTKPTIETNSVPKSRHRSSLVPGDAANANASTNTRPAHTDAACARRQTALCP
eukprot:1380966-Pleurochrysis_carterae.AAC.1